MHGLVGSDFRFRPHRTLGVLERLCPDVVALQEVYAGRHRGRELDQAAWLSKRLGMSLAFGPARELDGGRYGNAVLSRHPLRIVRAENLPQPAGCERRAALRVAIQAPWGELDIVNTHLGLRGRERAAQTHVLVADWLTHVREGSFSVFCGDLNALPTSGVCRTFATLLRDAQRAAEKHRARSTWPAPCPVLRLDHVFISANLAVLRCLVPADGRARLASDHLPVVVDLAPAG